MKEMTETTVAWKTKPPKGWRTGFNGEVACPHRDMFVCTACEEANKTFLASCFGTF